MPNYGNYYIGIRLLLLKEYLQANAGKDRIVRRRELEEYLTDSNCSNPFNVVRIKVGSFTLSLKNSIGVISKYSQIAKNSNIEGRDFPEEILLIYPRLWPKS